jgi:hypothetical protein
MIVQGLPFQVKGCILRLELRNAYVNLPIVRGENAVQYFTYLQCLF